MTRTYAENGPIYLLTVGKTGPQTSLIFLVYDRCVERRQREIVYAAVHSAANTSLLEEKVKQRTHKLIVSKQKLQEANLRIQESSAAQLEHFASMSHEIRTRTYCFVWATACLVYPHLIFSFFFRSLFSSNCLLSFSVDERCHILSNFK